MATMVFTGGGSGGHIYPGLAVAQELRRLMPGVRIVWIGSRVPLDRTIVDAGGLADRFYGIPTGKLRRYFSLKTLADGFHIIAGFFVALAILVREKPAALFSKGGYVSVPPCFAARLLDIPVFAHECDFSPGLATRLTARLAARIFVSYAETARFFPPAIRKRLIVSGNPVRPAIYHGRAEAGRAFLGIPERTGKPVLLVLGGSLGAREINQTVEANLGWLCGRFIVAHQTGANPVPGPADAVDYHRYEFFHAEMPDVLAAADVVLSRAGASALWEGAVCGKAMVLMPLSTAGSRGDQIENAAFFAAKGAALVADGNTGIRDALEKMLDVDERSRMGEAVRHIAGSEPPATGIAKSLAGDLS
ncbi:MAG: UDP-N-acetylglucosamine--N-acetylmuramyl-(pentapeptide) pyrophosphoryl-undecaprenol N-acetylglucosamine transferase [Spirochaetaceae bacterium]|jgi:UDP-N-acetylglucosamine--N-acetylmuramyl-(pentapeptide) pyrophosphoryl-undecaprenol N-acetylglucosamine transferase|nr:UDP-N-acetylglucosamine--N-acetylmuramyl-(pentapeptide) pyrophosphoryl-undecaprenol N-acetylglucosamine transferase [Spirochaetaceae bacterium]